MRTPELRSNAFRKIVSAGVRDCIESGPSVRVRMVGRTIYKGIIEVNHGKAWISF